MSNSDKEKFSSEENAEQQKVYLLPCGGNRPAGMEPGHIYKVYVGDWPNGGGTSVGFLSFEEATKTYPHAEKANSHTLCPKCSEEWLKKI